MPNAKSNRALELGNEMAGVLVKRHFTILPSLRSAICEEFEKIIPVLCGETIEEALACVQSVMNGGAISSGQYSAEQVAQMIGGALGQVRLLIDAIDYALAEDKP